MDKGIIFPVSTSILEKFSFIQLKNKISLIIEGEQGTHILKPIPNVSKNADQILENEVLNLIKAQNQFDKNVMRESIEKYNIQVELQKLEIILSKI